MLPNESQHHGEQPPIGCSWKTTTTPHKSIKIQDNYDMNKDNSTTHNTLGPHQTH